MTLPYSISVLTASVIALADMYEEGMMSERDVAEALVQCVCDYYEDSATEQPSEAPGSISNTSYEEDWE